MKHFLFLVLLFLSHSVFAKPLVITSFSILKDMVTQIGQDKVEVKALVGPNQDSHIFEPRPQDAAALGKADLVVINGLGFEGWMNRLITASGCQDKLVVTTKGITPLTRRSHGREILDPHAWHSLQNAEIYIENICQGLSKILPQDANFFKARAETYKKHLRALKEKTKQALSEVSEEKRKILTNHEAFRYLGEEFGITFFSPVGTSTEAEPSAKAVATLINRIKKDRIRAVFVENISNPRLIEQIAQETGIEIGGILYSDALDVPGTQADTYLKMMVFNLASLTKAIQRNRESMTPKDL